VGVAVWRFNCVEPHIAVIYPQDDLIVHDVHGGDACICGPAVEPVPCRDGSMSWMVTHHSLDGREERERQQQE
jgi:hypothetical protein